MLAINKEPVTCFYDIENACQALDTYESNDGKLNMTIFREVNYRFVLNNVFLFALSFSSLRTEAGWLGIENCSLV